MVVLFIDGFDKYGPVGTGLGGNYPSEAALMTNIQTEWTNLSYEDANCSIVAGLSITGTAFGASTIPVYFSLQKTLPSNVSEIIGGFRFQSGLLGSPPSYVEFLDITNIQCTITINAAGNISLLTGSSTGTVLGTSSATILANSTHYLEWDIVIGSSAAYTIYLDGVSILTGTGNTRGGSTNNYTNSILLYGNNGSNGVIYNSFIIDDLYLFDTTGSTCNTVLLTSPRIETQFPIGDSAVTFTFGAGLLGTPYVAANSSAPGANTLFLRKYKALVNATMGSVSCLPEATSGTANITAVIYSDNAGTPNTLLSSGTQVTGLTASTLLTSPLITPQSLVAGTNYWIGFITDTSVALYISDGNTSGAFVTNTYTSGAPSTAPSMTYSEPSWYIVGNITAASTNWSEVEILPPPGDQSYVYSLTPSNEDLYTFPVLTTTPVNIYTMGVKGYIRRGDTGTRTIEIHTKSSTSDSAGSLTAVSPGTTYAWIDSYFSVDPNTSSAWTATALNSSVSGVKIAS